MSRRALDLVCATAGLILTAPVLALAALAIRLASPGPVLHRARRIGRGGRPFTMYKLRTMRVARDGRGSRITGVDDPRVFPVGDVLRRTKIDELPQLVNVLRGDMAIIGPRPEDPDLVARYYAPAHRETLTVRPGLASPGSLYHDTHGHRVLAGGDPEALYAEHLLPVKLALDLVYVRRASVAYDLALMGRTVVVILGKLFGRRRFPEPPELAAARSFVTPARRPRLSAAVVVVALLAVGGACTGAEPPLGDEPGPEPAIGDTALLVAAGDIASCGSDGDERTAALLDSLAGIVITTGDNAYPNGALDDYEQCYAPSWGRHRDRTRPVPGNHEYQTADAAGYFDYFGAAAGARGAGYYGFDLGAWRVVGLNSEIDMDASSAQMAWLLADLAANPRRCVLAYWHRPRFSSGSQHGSSTRSQEVWQALYQAGADVVLVGHEHNYERFAPQTAEGALDTVHGIRQFVVGTGGADSYGFGTPLPNSEVRQAGTAGVLALRLLPDAYEWRFVPVAGATFTDAGSAECHDPPAPAAARR